MNLSCIEKQTYEYTVVGAGPAAICAIAKLIITNVPTKKIAWIDPEFKVGHFGTALSIGSSVPGNTKVQSYQNVYHDIYKSIPACRTNEEKHFALDDLDPESVCSIRIAAAPLQNLSDKLKNLVQIFYGKVSTIDESLAGLKLQIVSEENIQNIYTSRVILAVGATPKTLKLPKELKIIPPELCFVKSALIDFIFQNPGIQKVAVIGSSHSAALSVMHLLQLGIAVRQVMNKPYQFAKTITEPNGIRFTQFDNTGLKGDVATFTKKLLEDKQKNIGKFSPLWEVDINKNLDNLTDCTHAVINIGYQHNASLCINGISLAHFKHDSTTTQILGPNNESIRGIFGVGIAFPLQVKAISGEIEFAVGIGKFWDNFSDRILQFWQNNSNLTQAIASLFTQI